MTNVAFVGLGVMGQRMLTNMVACGGFTPAQGWDPSSDACAKAREICPSMAIADDPMAMIAGDDIDLVYIATPPDFRRMSA